MLYKVILFLPLVLHGSVRDTRIEEGGARKNNSSHFLRQLSQILVRCTLLGEMRKQENTNTKMIMRANDKGEYTEWGWWDDRGDLAKELTRGRSGVVINHCGIPSTNHSHQPLYDVYQVPSRFEKDSPLCEILSSNRS